MTLRLFFLLLAMCCSHAAVASGQAQFTRKAALPTWIAPLAVAAPTTHKEPVVIRLAESQILLGGRTTLLVHRVVQVNEKAALREIGQYHMAFNPAYQKLVVHRIVVQRGQQQLDRTAATAIRLIDREDALDDDVLGGQVTAQILLDDVRVGDSLDIVYSIEGSNPVFGERWSDSFAIDDAAPIERRLIVVTHPANRPVQWRQLGDGRKNTVSASVEPAGMRERLVLDAHGMDAVQLEPSIPTRIIPVQLIQMTEYRSWAEVAQWAAGLFQHGRPSAAVQALAGQFAESDSKTAQASAALHWVQEQIRYLSVSVGENSHRPQAPDEVLRRRYGDCKDKTNLYLAILAALGIQGEPVLVASSAPEVPGRILPAPDWFDHVIARVQVDGKTYFVDPTRTDELGTLPALVSPFPSAQGLPARPADLPWREREEFWTIERFDGDAMLELRQRWRGLYALAARGGWGRASDRERKDTLLAELEKHYAGAKLVSAPALDNLEDGAVFSVTARFSVPAPLTLRDGAYELAYHSGIVDGTIGLPDKLSRTYPFAFAGGAFHGRYLTHVRWPAQARAEVEPVARHLDNAFFTAHSEGVQHGNQLEYVFDYRVKRAEIGQDEMVALQHETRAMFDLMEGAFRFQKDWAAGSGLASASLREAETIGFIPYMAELRRLLNTPVWNADQVKQACAGAVAFLNAEAIPKAGVLSDALRDRLARMADTPKAQTCVASLAFLSGDPGRAWPLMRGPDAAAATQVPLRAQVLLAMGKPDQARTLLLADWSRQRADGALAQLDAVRLLALFQRSGTAAPPELVEYIAPATDPTWPRPIASMLLDRMPEDALIQLAERSDGDLREARLAEAWYFVGQHRLARQDKTGAIDAFAWHRTHGSRTQLETLFALAEVRRLIEDDADYRAGLMLADSDKFDAAYARYLPAAQRGVVEAEYRLGQLYARERHDSAHALEWLGKAAADGSADAANELAIMYADGLGTAVDTKRAGELFERSAHLGNRHGAYNLAHRREHGSGGFTRDPEQAFLLYRDAAILGQEDAMAMLAEFYIEGKGVARAPQLSLAWSSLGALNGNMRAQADLAFLYKWGYGVKQDQALAIKLYLEAAQHDVESAQVQLGNCYEYGLGTDKNAGEAMKWYRLAAKHGNSYAQASLARLTLQNKPSPAEAHEAIGTLQHMLDDGDLERAADLGRAYETGIGVAPDLDRAIAYYKQGSDKGNRRAQVQLADLYYTGPPARRDCAAALALYQQAAAGDDGHALNNLGDMYEKGCGVPADIERAIALYTKAARMGEAIAFASLGELYDTGRGLQRAPREAYVYFMIAARLGFRQTDQHAQRLRAAVAQDQLAQADAQAAAWQEGDPLPQPSGERPGAGPASVAARP